MATFKCGIKGSGGSCRIEEYPVCAPDMTGFEGLRRVYIQKGDDGIRPVIRVCEEKKKEGLLGAILRENTKGYDGRICYIVPEPSYEPVIDEKDLLKKPGRNEERLSEREANTLLDTGWFEEQGINGLCRSESKRGVRREVDERGNVISSDLYDLYGYERYLSRLERLVHRNDIPKGNYVGRPFPLLADEASCLFKDLQLTSRDLVCSPKSCAPERPYNDNHDPAGSTGRTLDNLFTRGLYLFTNDPARLKDIRAAVDGMTCPALTAERREELKNFLQKLIDDSPSNGKGPLSDRDKIMFIVTILNTIIWSVLGGIWIYEKLSDKFKDKVKLTDVGKRIRDMLAKEPEFDIRSAREDAIKFWRRMDSIRFRSLIVSGISGSGKDIRIDEMLILKEKGDPSVPEFAREARVFEISGVEFNSNTKYRGTVADKLKEISELVEKEVVILRVREIDLILMAGSVEGGDAERVAKLLLSMLETKKNLVLLGSTSRLSELLRTDPDLERRFNIAAIAESMLKDVVGIIDEGDWRKKFEGYHNVRFGKDVLFAAGALAEKVYRPSTVRLHEGRYQQYPRFDAVLSVLEEALRIAKGDGRAEATVEDVVRATESLSGQTLDGSYVSDLLARAAKDISMLDSEISFAAERVVERIRGAKHLRDFFERPEGESIMRKFAENMVRRWEEMSDPEREQARLVDALNGFKTKENDVAICIIEREIDNLRKAQAMTHPVETSSLAGSYPGALVPSNPQMIIAEIAEQLKGDRRYSGLFRERPALAASYARVLYRHWEAAVRSGAADHWVLLDERMGLDVRRGRLPVSFIEAKMAEIDNFAESNGLRRARPGISEEDRRIEEDGRDVRGRGRRPPRRGPVK